ncbi:MAG TPA: hypothetical protein VLW55_07580 [Burkholderiaceae bacterium]|nr:hypothetical protein [Burkholderiaceae bacterium]
MARGITAASKIIHSPILLDWTEEKLRTLDQDQLLNLLSNLDHQRAIGRLSESTAAVLEQRISALLTKRSSAKRRSDVDGSALIADTDT